MTQKVLVTGASGLVGKRVCKELLFVGKSVIAVGRADEQSFRLKFDYPCEYVQWSDPVNQPFPSGVLEQVETVIHLAGESVASGRWTKARKKSIYDSRVCSTKHLVNAVLESENKPKEFLCASAVGIYPDGNEELTEEYKEKGDSFLGKVCIDWEKALEPLSQTSVRDVSMRIGVVLALGGGFLNRVEGLFSNGLGGRLGSGKQWVSWIHLEDLARLVLFVINNKEIKGAINFTAPNPIQNKDLTQFLVKTLKSWVGLPVPRLAAKIAMGGPGELGFVNQRVIPKKAIDAGYEFLFADFKSAIKNIYGWREKSIDRYFYAEQWVNQPVDKVFEFFVDEKNLEEITPDFLSFKVLKMSTDKIQEGTLIDYQLKIHGVPAKWRSKIEKWVPGKQFVDTQIKGPYSKWHHTHSFYQMAGGTLLTDKVLYRAPFGFLGQSSSGWMIKKDVKEIFSYRKKTIQKLFG